MKKLLFWLLLLCSTQSNSQNKTVDSLLNCLQSAKEDTSKLKILLSITKNGEGKNAWFKLKDGIALAEKLSRSDDEQISFKGKKAHATFLNDMGYIYINEGNLIKSLDCFEKGLKLQEEINDRDGAATSLNNIAAVYYNQGEMAKALDYFNRAIKIQEEIKDKNGVANTLLNIGSIHLDNGDPTKALDYYMKSLKMEEELGGKSGMASALHNIGYVWYTQRDFQKALDYYMRGLKIDEELNDIEAISSSLNTIGEVYAGLHNTSSALKYFERSLKIQEEAGSKKGMALAYGNIAATYYTKGDIPNALDYYNKSLKVRRGIDDKFGLVFLLNNIGYAYLILARSAATPGEKNQKLQIAFAYSDSSLQLAKELKNPINLRNAEGLLAKIDSARGNMSGAYEHYKQHIIYRDKVINIETKTSALKKEFEFEVEKKETKNKVLAQQNEIQSLKLSQNKFFMIGLFTLLIVVLLIAYLLARQNKFRNEQREMQLEQKLLRSQMNPHFIFNSLQAIQNYILKHDQKEAVKYLSSFANITRSVLENSRKDFIPLKKEIALLENYLHLQKLRFGDRFEYEIHVDPEIDLENIELPPMLSQPFIENALEHGMKDIEKGGKIDIYFTVKDNNLLFEIKDNGKGIQTSDSSIKQHQSLALAITNERVALMNKRKSKKTIFNISAAFPNELERKGVKVQFSIPI